MADSDGQLSLIPVVLSPTHTDNCSKEKPRSALVVQTIELW